MLWPIFVLFGPWWWILVIVASIWIIAAIEQEKGFMATVVFVGAFIAMTVFGTVPIVAWATGHPWLTAGILGAYLLIGGPITGVLRWFTFVHDELEKYELAKRSWLRSHDVDGPDMPENLRLKWLQHVESLFSWIKITGEVDTTRQPVYDRGRAGPIIWDPATIKIKQSFPKAWDYKSRIVTWMAYWPWTLFWMLLNDVISRWFRIIQERLAGFMNAISRRVFKRVKGDFELPQSDDEKTSK